MINHRRTRVYEAPEGSKSYVDIYLDGASDDRRVIVLLRRSCLSFEQLCDRKTHHISYGFGNDIMSMGLHIAKQLEFLVPLSVISPNLEAGMGGFTYRAIHHEDIIRDIGQFWDSIHGSKNGVSPTEFWD